MKQQTAVEWLANKILKLDGINDIAIPDNLFEQAKQMEREQIEKCGRVMYNNGVIDSGLSPSDYYTQNYGE